MPTRMNAVFPVPGREYSPVNLSDEQRDLAVDHLPLIGIIAKDIESKVSVPISFDQLATVGAGGLIDAALHYHTENKLPFGIYARRRIRRAMMTYLNQSTVVRPAGRLLT